jgi:hypothetical protein
VREAIVSCHGWITDFHEFSNLSICIGFETPIEQLPLLTKSLLAAGITFSTKSEQFLHSLDEETATGPIECSLQVTFIHNEPDLRRKVIAVPG